MTRRQYNYLQSNLVSQIKADEAKKVGFKTAKAAKEAKANLAKLRDERRDRKQIFCKDSALDRYAYNRGRQVLDMAAKYPSHYYITTTIGDKFDVRYDKEYDQDMYARSYGHPGIIHTYHVTVPRTGIRFTDTDGLIMAYDKVIEKHGLTIMHGYINAARGCMVSLQEVYFVHDGIRGAHGVTVADAIADIKKKKAKDNRDRIKSLDDTITAAKYQRMTGACNAGTDAWLSRHGYTRRDKITIRQLLSEIKETDFGYKKLHSTLTAAGLL